MDVISPSKGFWPSIIERLKKTKSDEILRLKLRDNQDTATTKASLQKAAQRGKVRVSMLTRPKQLFVWLVPEKAPETSPKEPSDPQANADGNEMARTKPITDASGKFSVSIVPRPKNMPPEELLNPGPDFWDPIIQQVKRLKSDEVLSLDFTKGDILPDERGAYRAAKRARVKLCLSIHGAVMYLWRDRGERSRQPHCNRR